MIGIVMLGESNSGKSTISKIVQKKLAENGMNVRYISTGDLARQFADANKLNAGQMADEQTMRNEIIKAIRSDDTSFILDGCPRFYEQYVWMNSEFDIRFAYFYISVPYWQIIERARKRGRSDDDAITTKHKYFYENTLPMIEQMFRDGEEVYLNNNSDGIDIEKLTNNMVDAIIKIGVEDSEDSRI
jgi:adenylate kinase family enzyme